MQLGTVAVDVPLAAADAVPPVHGEYRNYVSMHVGAKGDDATVCKFCVLTKTANSCDDTKRFEDKFDEAMAVFSEQLHELQGAAYSGVFARSGSANQGHARAFSRWRGRRRSKSESGHQAESERPFSEIGRGGVWSSEA